MSEFKGLDIKLDQLDGAAVLVPQGDIDMASSPLLRSRLQEAESSRASRVVVDLTGVSYMDSSGVATLVEAMQVSRRAGQQLVLFGMQDRVRSIFEIAKLDSVFTIVESLPEALDV